VSDAIYSETEFPVYGKTPGLSSRWDQLAAHAKRDGLRPARRAQPAENRGDVKRPAEAKTSRRNAIRPAEADQMEKGVGGPALSDRILDAVCLTGPLSRCREQLSAFRSAGVDLPILVAPIGVDGARGVIKAFRR